MRIESKRIGEGRWGRHGERSSLFCCGGGGGAIRAELSSAGDVVMAHRSESGIHDNNVHVTLSYILLCITYTSEYMQK